MKLAFLVSAVLMMSNLALADIGGGQLRDELTVAMGNLAIAKVLSESKNSNSLVSKILARHDLEDGRNNDGTINKPLLNQDIKALLLNGEDQFGVYCANPDAKGNQACSSGKSASFLVSVASRTGVHKAADFESVNILVEVEKNYSWIRDENEKDSQAKTETTVKVVKELELK